LPPSAQLERAAHVLDERCSTRPPSTASDRLARELRTASTALAHAYVRFATEHAALLEVLFAAKHREQDGTACTRRPPRRWPSRPRCSPATRTAPPPRGDAAGPRSPTAGCSPANSPTATVAAAVERRVRGLAAR